MSNRKRRENTGNFISEWYGFRIYPKVASVDSLVPIILEETCPFLSAAKDDKTRCIKRENRTLRQTDDDGTEVRVKVERTTGVCTINSMSEGIRKDWIACPYRILDIDLIEKCTRHLFSIPDMEETLIIAAPTLKNTFVMERVLEMVSVGASVFVFFEQRMGGEISLPLTDGSPELSFDITLVEIVKSDVGYDVGRYGIIELQTADFHGSPSHAVGDLRKAADLYSEDDEEFANELTNHPQWLSNKVEGPNISNIFKRTFYQMMFKFQLVKDNRCAGCVLIIPVSVWDSWQRHLGKPELEDKGDGYYVLSKPLQDFDDTIDQGDLVIDDLSWIYVVEIQSDSGASPNPLVVNKMIATNAASFSYFALEKAPEIAVKTSAKSLVTTLRQRIMIYWPGFGAAQSSLF